MFSATMLLPFSSITLKIQRTTLLRIRRGYLNSKTSVSTATVEERSVERSVFISQSDDIHTNLALEDWFYRHEDFNRHRILLLWKNKPTVVIGKHQNIWTEVDMDEAEKYNVHVARRNSGGGTVYHDEGNLNCSFFTTRNDYHRRFNLAIIQRALTRLGFQVEVNCKDDLTVLGSKISGSASKLGKNAYHHCTLLIDSDLHSLSSLLNPKTDGIISRATVSKKSPVSNLTMHNQEVSMGQVLSLIGHEFLRTDTNGVDCGEFFAEKQRGFQLLNPSDDWFPGLEAIKTEFQSWDWNVGKTPEFSVTRPIALLSSSSSTCEVELKVVKGLVQSACVNFPLDFSPERQHLFTTFLTSLEGKPFFSQLFQRIERWATE